MDIFRGSRTFYCTIICNNFNLCKWHSPSFRKIRFYFDIRRMSWIYGWTISTRIVIFPIWNIVLLVLVLSCSSVRTFNEYLIVCICPYVDTSHSRYYSNSPAGLWKQWDDTIIGERFLAIEMYIVHISKRTSISSQYVVFFLIFMFFVFCCLIETNYTTFLATIIWSGVTS